MFTFPITKLFKTFIAQYLHQYFTKAITIFYRTPSETNHPPSPHPPFLPMKPFNRDPSGETYRRSVDFSSSPSCTPRRGTVAHCTGTKRLEDCNRVMRSSIFQIDGDKSKMSRATVLSARVYTPVCAHTCGHRDGILAEYSTS